MSQAYVRGYQGARLDDATSIAACAKHYVGYGAAEAGRDYNTTEIPERLLRQVYLAPFHAAVDAGVATLMSAFNPLNEIPATANSFTLDQVLRREWGFKGFVISDYTAVRELIAHGIAVDGATAARKAFVSGVDMDMESGLFLTELQGKVKTGKIPIEAVDQAVRRVLRVKVALGLFEHPYVEGSQTTVDSADVDLAKTAAEESFVLLKNGTPGGGAAPLPLTNVRAIALIGPLADSAVDMLGPHAARGNPKDVITLRAALSDYSTQKRIELFYEKGPTSWVVRRMGFPPLLTPPDAPTWSCSPSANEPAICPGKPLRARTSLCRVSRKSCFSP